MSVTVKEVEEITSGSGLWAYEEYNDTGVYNALVDVGMVKDSKLTAEREWDIIEDGTPVVEVKRICNREKGTWECVLGEDVAEEKILKLGAGTISEVAARTGVSKSLTKTLTGTAWESLGVSHKANSTLSTTDFTVASTDPTPVNYDSGDFAIGEKEGMLAIRRKSDGDIPNRGQVTVGFTANIPGYRKFVFGGTNTTKTYYFEHYKETDDGDLKILKMYKVAPPGKDEDVYPSEGFPSNTVAFGLQADHTRPQGEQLYEKNWEDENIA